MSASVIQKAKNVSVEDGIFENNGLAKKNAGVRVAQSGSETG